MDIQRGEKENTPNTSSQGYILLTPNLQMEWSLQSEGVPRSLQEWKWKCLTLTERIP